RRRARASHGRNCQTGSESAGACRVACGRYGAHGNRTDLMSEERTIPRCIPREKKRIAPKAASAAAPVSRRTGRPLSALVVRRCRVVLEAILVSVEVLVRRQVHV